MRLALAGAHGTGKTTLLNALRERPEFAEVTFLPEITRIIKQQGFAINEAGNLDTQILVMNTHMTNLLCNKNFIVDRCLIDGYVYTHYLFNHEEVPEDMEEYASFLLRSYVYQYDRIFYLPVEFDLHDDGVRSVNPEFRTEIERIFKFVVPAATKYGAKITTLTGSVSERVEQVIRSLK